MSGEIFDYQGRTADYIHLYLAIVLCVSEVLPIAVLGCVGVSVELAVLALLVGHSRDLK